MIFASSHFESKSTNTVSPARLQLCHWNSAWPEVAILFVVALAVMLPQFRQVTFSSCVIDDSILQMSWVQQFTQTLWEGTFLPKWLPESNGGDGSPVFVFYSPLVYYLTAAVQSLGGSIPFSMKVIRFLALWLSGVSMLFFMRKVLRGRSSLIASLIYLLLPFHVLDVTYWTLYAEPWAWVWFPFILWSLILLTEEHQSLSVSLPAVAVSFAGLILTHLVSAYMFSFLMVAFVCFWSPRSKRWHSLFRLTVAAVSGLALAAFYLLPAYYERRFVHLEYSTLLPEFNFRNTFLFFPNPTLLASNAFQARTIALLRWVTILQLFGLLVSAIAVGCSASVARLRRLAWFALVVAISCLFMMSSASAWAWDWIPAMPQIQFSTRWLSTYTMAGAILAGVAFTNLLGPGSSVRLSLWLRPVAVICLVCFAIADFLLLSSNCFVTADETAKAASHLYNAPEYNPLSMPNWRQRIIPAVGSKWWLTQGDGKVELLHWSAHRRSLSIDSQSGAKIKLRLLSYPGWNTRIDGAKVPASMDVADGRIWAQIPSGRHILQMSFENTWWRNLACAVSVSTGVILFWLSSRRIFHHEVVA